LLVAALALLAETFGCWLLFVLNRSDLQGALGIQLIGAVVALYVLAQSFLELRSSGRYRAMRGTWLIALILSVLTVLGCAAPILVMACLWYVISDMEGFSIPFL
jgi:drug/metabolite transporter superfamily protein YnfA